MSDILKQIQKPRATLDEYCEFICDPQKEGAWSLRLELSETQLRAITTLLNLPGRIMRVPRRFIIPSGSRYRVDAYEEFPPVLLPRLFAYVRAAIPPKERSELPDLLPKEDPRQNFASPRFQRRSYYYVQEVLSPPNRLSTAKRHRLSKAVTIYRQNFGRCIVRLVPEDISGIDVSGRNPLTYFQVSEEASSVRISSPCEITLRQIMEMFQSVIPEKLVPEFTKIYSPENTLMGMYLPILQIVPLNAVLKDKIAARNVQQALDEAREERFVHAIRAIGIAAEELLVEIYETYVREKAPQAPLGNIIHELGQRLQELLHGTAANKENPISILRKQIGKAMDLEKKSSNNPSLLLLAQQLQKGIIPLLEGLKQMVEDNPQLNTRGQATSLFPAKVQRCLSELVVLRNRVSHRVERVVSVAAVGYIDTAIALRDFIVVAKWWEVEKRQINYRALRNVMIQETLNRSRAQEQELELSS
jgi:hypothetical protein